MMRRVCRFDRIAQTECGTKRNGKSACVLLRDCTKNTTNHLIMVKALSPGKESIPEWKLILARGFIFNETLDEVYICQQHRDEFGKATVYRGCIFSSEMLVSLQV